MLCYTAALRWPRNFTFLITFGLGGLWKMLYAPSGFHSTQILQEFTLTSGFREEMVHPNICLGFSFKKSCLGFFNIFSPYPIWKSTIAPKVSTPHLSCSRSRVSLGSLLHLPLSRNAQTLFSRYLHFIPKPFFWNICHARFSLWCYFVSQGRCAQGSNSFKLVNSRTLFRPSLICYKEGLWTWL